jgi:hypothetical protein
MMVGAKKPRRGSFRHVTRKKIVITDPATKALIAELTKSTGESIDDAVEAAVDARLARINDEMRRRVEWSRKQRPSLLKGLCISRASSPGRREAP